MADQPQHVPPVYTAEAVAEAILHAATTPVRDLFVGGGAKMASSIDRWAPRLGDRVVGRLIGSGTHSGRPPRHGEEALHSAGGGLREDGDYPGMARRSLYTTARIHPVLTGAAAVGAGLVVAALWRSSSESRSSERAPSADLTDAELDVQSPPRTATTVP
jgi:hypothetical protein